MLRKLHSRFERDFRHRNASLRFEKWIRIGQKFLLDPSEVQMCQKECKEPQESCLKLNGQGVRLQET